MPTYTYKCKCCEEITTETKSIAQYKETPICACGEETEQVILKAPRVGRIQSNLDYQCVATGEKITSWKQREEVLKRNDLVAVG